MGDLLVLVPDYADLEVGDELRLGRSVVLFECVYQVVGAHRCGAPELREPGTGRLLCLQCGWADGQPCRRRNEAGEWEWVG